MIRLNRNLWHELPLNSLSSFKLRAFEAGWARAPIKAAAPVGSSAWTSRLAQISTWSTESSKVASKLCRTHSGPQSPLTSEVFRTFMVLQVFTSFCYEMFEKQWLRERQSVFHFTCMSNLSSQLPCTRKDSFQGLKKLHYKRPTWKASSRVEHDRGVCLASPWTDLLQILSVV